MDLKKAIIEVFDTHPKVDEFFMTSDGQFFEVSANADFHASRLPEKGVAKITRDQAETLKAKAIDTDLIHPEATSPTAEEIEAKHLQDEAAQQKLNAALSGGDDKKEEPPVVDTSLKAVKGNKAAVAAGVDNAPGTNDLDNANPAQ